VIGDDGGRRSRIFRVYVIELDDAAGPRARAELPCVYVGQTADTPEERFAEHKSGHHASRHVKRHGIRLRPDLYATLPLVPTREQAEELERRVAEELARRGYTVFGGH
jgi:predicted GIY-YIG superfamily endonuclease